LQAGAAHHHAGRTQGLGVRPVGAQ